MTRRLAAILAADVVGYSALMGADQEGTLAALRQLRAEVFGPAVAGHRGKVVKSMGDGWLVEFASAVDAVTCAMQVQDRLADHPTVKLRIGVHVGDVVHEDEDVFGDGVNVAARLEALAEPAAVVISDAVHGSLDGTLRPSFDDNGEQSLKNIERPIRVWTRGGSVARSARSDQQAAVTRLDIVPVATSDTRPEVRELADALTSDLYNHLGHMHFTRAAMTTRPSTDAFGLRPVLRTRGERLRLEIRLSAPGDDQHWVAKYDGDLADSFDWQDETVREAAGYFHGVIVKEEMQRLAAKPIASLSASEAVAAAHMSQAHQIIDRPQYLMDLCEHAITQAPDWGPAYAGAIVTYYTALSGGKFGLVSDWDDRIDGWVEQARKLTCDDPQSEMWVAFVIHIRAPDPARMRLMIMNALKEIPFDPGNLGLCGLFLVFLGEPELGTSCARKSLEFTHPSRHPAAIVNTQALAAVQLGRYEEALQHARHALTISGDFVPAWRAIAAAAAHLGKTDEVREAMARLQDLHPGDTLDGVRRRSGYVDNEYTQRFFEGLRLAGLPEGDA